MNMAAKGAIYIVLCTLGFGLLIAASFGLTGAIVYGLAWSTGWFTFTWKITVATWLVLFLLQVLRGK